jgi:single-stranded-DNA-specific exonuclease
MEDCVSLVKSVISQRGRICIYGDYDVDGTAGCAILFRTLKRMGANVECMIPSRMEHGYGLSVEAVEAMRGYALLITVDCGISNTAEIEKAKGYGVRTIITDHHECGHALPAADYILNAKCPGESYPDRELCGAGVAFKLAEALIGEDAYEYMDIAAVATIADIVPLTGENRVIAKLGVDKINRRPTPGLAQLIKKAKIKNGKIDSQAVAYVLAPRINAAGRISTAKTSFELMTEEGDFKLGKLAEELCALNADRQARQERVVREAMDMVDAPGDKRIILLHKKDWDVGIIGLAAARIVEKYNRPAILFGEAGGFYTGSARSIDGVNIFEALATQADLYEKFGGHSGAAGLTLEEKHLDTLAGRMDLYLRETYTSDVFLPVRYYDLDMEPGQITAGLLRELDMLEPYGFKNRRVDMLVRNADISDVRPIGEDRYARFTLSRGGARLNGVTFGRQAHSIPGRADVIGAAQINTFDRQPQMIVDTFSYQEKRTEAFARETEMIARAKKTPEQAKGYFCDRETLLKYYRIFKGLSDNKTEFADMESLLQFVGRHIRDAEAGKVAFAAAVLGEIGLLDIKKDDKIQVTVKKGKKDLEDSQTYKLFAREEKEDESKSES